METKAPAQVGYARNEREETILIRAGMSPRYVYLEGRESETLSEAIRALRSGGLVAVVGGLRAFGDKRGAIMASLAEVHNRGGVVLDIDTGLRSDRNGAEMLDGALRKITGQSRMPPGKAEAMAAKSARVRRKGRMPKREALVFWRDPALTARQAIELMTGWQLRTAYDHLGSRGLPSGRLPK